MLSYAKAIVSGLAGGVTALIAATADGSGISLNEWLITAGAVLAASGLTALVPNKGADNA